MASVFRRYPSDDISWYYPDVDESDGGPLFFQDVVGQEAWQIGEDFWEAPGGASLVAQDAVSAGVAENAVLVQHHVLVAQDAIGAGAADNVVLGVSVTLAPQDALSATVAEQPNLTQHHILALADAQSLSAAEEPVLVHHHILALQDAVSQTVAENVDLAQTHVLTTEDAVSLATSDNLDLAQTHVLTIADAVALATADNVELVSSVPLIVADGLSGTEAEVVLLGYQYAIWGTVRDKTGVPIAGADINLFNTGTHALVHNAVSDSGGKYFSYVTDNYTNHFLVAFYGASPRKAAVTVDTLKGK